MEEAFRRFVFGSVICFTAVSYASSSEAPGLIQVNLSHIEKGGVGYNTGYTTLEMFMAPSLDRWIVMPFVDLRGHVFDDGKLAANAGIGIRALAGSRIYGLNSYYDYRNTKHQHYNQVALGVESLGVKWDFRLNGYLPLGDTTSSKYGEYRTLSASTFDSFFGNSVLVSQTRREYWKVEYAMKGIDSEASFHFFKNTNFDLYAAAGPYYYNYNSKQAIGGRARFGAQVYEYLSLELINSYDSRFHENLQGRVGLNISFGPKKPLQKHRKSKDFDSVCFLNQRLIQSVERQEIIVVDHFRKTKTSEKISIAINPETQEPYTIWFVNNTSQSNGTYESPFHRLVDAQNASSSHDIIYVFSGDDTSTGMDTGIVLKDYQMLLGASRQYDFLTSVGLIEVPAQNSIEPTITNSGDPVVTLANHNTVSGFFIDNANSIGIAGNEITGFNALSNTIVGGAYGEAVFLSNVSGEIVVNGNRFEQIDQISANNYAVHIYLDQNVETSATLDGNFYSLESLNSNRVSGVFVDLEGDSTLSALNILNSDFTASNDGSNVCYGVNVNLVSGNLPSINALNNSFNSIGEDSLAIWINISHANDSAVNLKVSDSVFNHISNSGYGIYSVQSNGQIKLDVTNCLFENITNTGTCIKTLGVGITDLNVTKSVFKGLDNATGIGFAQPFGSAIHSYLNVSECLFDGITSNSAGVVTFFGDNDPASVVIVDNTFKDISGSYGMVINQVGSAVATLNLSGNTFTGDNSNSTGWASNIESTLGTVCLGFLNNTAAPQNTPIPYKFSQSGSSVFNRTSGSDSSTNVGLISEVGSIGATGSCFE